MPRKVRRRQTSFASGEMSPVLAGRSDLDRYHNACETLVNWLPLVQGGAKRFPGTAFLRILWGEHRLEAFEFSVDTTFLFAFRDGFLDIYQAGTLHQTLATPWTAALLWEFDYTQALDTVLVVHEDHAPRRIYRGPGDVFAIEDLSDAALTIKLTNVPQEDGADVWSASRGWPRTVTFHENRLCFGGSLTYPNRLWFSKSGDYFNFDQGTGLADEAIADERLSDQLEVVQWVGSMRRLLMGSSSQEWAQVADGYMTPDLVDIKPQSAIGSERISPVSIDGSVLHVARGGRQVHELVWADVEQAFTTRALNLLAPRAVTGARQLSARRARTADTPHLVFVVNADGVLGVLATLRDQDFLAWCRRTFAGVVESAASVGDDTYFVVSYTFGPGVYESGVYEPGVYEESGGSSSRFLVSWDDALFTDFSKTVTAVAPATTWTGFEHLGGRTVQVVLDGAMHPDVTVSAAGEIVTEWEGTTLTAGVALPTPTLTPMSPVSELQDGSTALVKRRISRVQAHVYETRSLTVAGRQLYFRRPTDPVGAPVPAFTGVKDVRLLGGFSELPTVTITAPEPLPATVLSLTTEVVY
jgi:hypothetical protein